MEEGPTLEVLSDPRHPYSWALANAVPRLDTPVAARLPGIEGMPPDPLAMPKGCRFAPRCPFRIARCTEERPPLMQVAPGRIARCWVTDDGRSLPPPTVPAEAKVVVQDKAEPLLEATDLVKHFPPARKGFQPSARWCMR